MNKNEGKDMSAASRGKSFYYAFSGLSQLVKNEPNVKIHCIATITVIAGGIIRHVSMWQWAALLFAIGLVLITEALNTCIELLCDFCCEQKPHPSIKVIKDISAAAVLIAAMISACIGIIVFIF